MITKAEGAMLHQLLFEDLPEDSRAAYPSEERIKAFHVKLDVFLAVNYGERPTVQQLALWDAD